MKNLFWLASGLVIAIGGFLAYESRRRQAVPELAHRLQEAWVDHHTVV